MDGDESYDGPDLHLENEAEEIDYELDAEQTGSGQPIEYGAFRQLMQGLLDLEHLSQASNSTPAQTQAQANITSRLEHISRLFTTRASPSLAQAINRARQEEAQPVADDEDVDDDDDEEESDTFYISRENRRDISELFPLVKEPQKAGQELLNGGEFGKISTKSATVNLARALRARATTTRRSAKEDLTSKLIPNSYGTAVASYDANIYSGQFSADSSIYYTCCQDFQLHIYDMTRPLVHKTLENRDQQSRRYMYEGGHQSNMKVMKTVQGHHGRWTITDSHLSPNNEKLIYSSITPTVYMTSTSDSDPVQVPINFADSHRSNRMRGWGGFGADDGFGIWSCRFSADGNEVVAGGSGRIFVYDLLADRRTVKIDAHENDVNSCCWADTASGNVLISASDDTFLKVWDRRSLGASPKPSGVLIGHTEGITYVSAKGDGRYVISNGKDQALRLWDLRKMRSNGEYESVRHLDYGLRDFDYRYGWYSRPRYMAHPKDCSVMTYRGHEVFKTLIRCHFSPAETTGSAYIYSGSANGKIHIWSLDGRIVQILDRTHTLPMTFDSSAPQLGHLKGDGHAVCVRDVSWHTKEPVIMSAGWEGSYGQSLVARHEWKGLSKMGGRLEDYIAKEVEESSEYQTSRRSQRLVPGQLTITRHLPGHYAVIEDDDEDDEDDEDYVE